MRTAVNCGICGILVASQGLPMRQHTAVKHPERYPWYIDVVSGETRKKEVSMSHEHPKPVAKMAKAELVDHIEREHEREIPDGSVAELRKMHTEMTRAALNGSTVVETYPDGPGTGTITVGADVYVTPSHPGFKKRGNETVEVKGLYEDKRGRIVVEVNDRGNLRTLLHTDVSVVPWPALPDAPVGRVPDAKKAKTPKVDLTQALEAADDIPKALREHGISDVGPEGERVDNIACATALLVKGETPEKASTHIDLSAKTIRWRTARALVASGLQKCRCREEGCQFEHAGR